MTQFFMAVFGLCSIYMAMGNNPRLRKWAPVVGLAGQPFWAVFAWQSQGLGLAVLVLAYSAVYGRGIVVQWRTA